MNALHLPDQVGVMILPDCVLFPHGGLPLRIFEDRYRMMLQDAIDGDCLFAVTQQISEDSADPQHCAAPVGTIGIIRASHEQEDGTSHLLLHGVIRVKFLEWLDEKPYPVATIQPIHSEFSPAHQKAAATKTLRGSVEDAIRGLPEEVQKAVMEMIHRTDDPVIIADIVSQQFFQDVDIRQHLLEIESPAARISYLCNALQRI
jgi:Lon protease-like protein